LVIAHAHFVARRYTDGARWAQNTVDRYPEHLWAYALLIATTAMRGEAELASEALANAVRIRPDFSLSFVSENFSSVGELAHFLAALRKAGVPER
jgi:hypothetical protein